MNDIAEYTYSTMPPLKQSDAAKLIVLIRKLRWAVMEDEADQLQRKLPRGIATDCALSTSSETD